VSGDLVQSILYVVTIVALVAANLLQGRRISYLEQRVRMVETSQLRRLIREYVSRGGTFPVDEDGK